MSTSMNNDVRIRVSDSAYLAMRAAVGLTELQMARRSHMRVNRLREIELLLDQPSQAEVHALATTVAREIPRAARRARGEGFYRALTRSLPLGDAYSLGYDEARHDVLKELNDALPPPTPTPRLRLA